MCADKLVDFHQFYTMYLESEQKLRELLVTGNVHNAIKVEISFGDSAIESLYIEPAIGMEVGATNRPTVEKPVEEVFIDVAPIDKGLRFECRTCRNRFKTKRSLTKHAGTCVTTVPSVR